MNLIFTLSYFSLYVRGFFRLYVCGLWRQKLQKQREKPFIYYMHLSLNLDPFFCSKGHIPTYIVEISFQIEKLDPFQRGIPTYMREFLFFAIAYHSGRFDIYSMFYTEPYTNDPYIVMKQFLKLHSYFLAYFYAVFLQSMYYM